MEGFKKLDTSIKKLVYFWSITFFVVISAGIFIRINNRPILFDSWGMEYVHSRITENGQLMMGYITELGSVKFIVLATGILCIYFLYRKNYNTAIFILLASLGTSIINQGLKYLVMRTRPEMYFLIRETGYSFPSGHSMIAMSFYSMFFYLLGEKYKSFRGLFLSLNILIVILIGFSRIYLGVHWPTDVLIGFLISYTWYSTVKYLYENKDMASCIKISE